MPHFHDVAKVFELLDSSYPETNLGNKANPLDELVYILISNQTNEDRYQQVYRAFRAKFPRWQMLLGASEEEIAVTLRDAGLYRIKSRFLKRIAERLHSDFGEVSLRKLRCMNDQEAEAYLCSLPGVQVKTARCIMMYSLDREVFPVDIHCLRTMSRLGWINWQGQRAEHIADVAQDGVPPHLRRGLHVRLIQHGREVCGPTPKCNSCVIARLCPTSSEVAFS